MGHREWEGCLLNSTARRTQQRLFVPFKCCIASSYQRVITSSGVRPATCPPHILLFPEIDCCSLLVAVARARAVAQMLSAARREESSTKGTRLSRRGVQLEAPWDERRIERRGSTGVVNVADRSGAFPGIDKNTWLQLFPSNKGRAPHPGACLDVAVVSTCVTSYQRHYYHFLHFCGRHFPAPSSQDDNRTYCSVTAPSHQP